MFSQKHPNYCKKSDMEKPRVDSKAPGECCGCTACESICPKDAITMQPDALGFLYPHIDEEKCINCGLCMKVCAFSPSYNTPHNFQVPLAYGARHKNEEEVESSRSGAAFIAISDYILEHGGVVYGAGYASCSEIVHKRATTKAERDEFKGSKYVQSKLGDTFKQIKQDLSEGRSVLFSGTPCQNAGLSAYIGEKLRSQLFLIDIVCHGVPSPYIWRDYLAYLQKQNASKIVKVNFRDKQIWGWKAHKESYVLDNGKKLLSDGFTDLFYKHIMLRESCGSCPYTNLRRPGDITIADFWGWERTKNTINEDNKGLSLVLCNTPKGAELFQSCSTDLNFFSVRVEDCLQPNLMHPSALDPRTKKFIKDYQRKGFAFVYTKYRKRTSKEKALKAYSNFKKVIKKILNRK